MQTCRVLRAPLQHICATSIILILIPALMSGLDQLTSNKLQRIHSAPRPRPGCVCLKGMDTEMIWLPTILF